MVVKKTQDSHREIIPDLAKAIKDGIKKHIKPEKTVIDFRNELTVFNDTGRSTYSLVPTYTPQYSGPAYNSLNEYLIRPDYYSSPRQIKIGLSVSF